ncbi:DUF6252 family protein [Mangrovimonas sp. AS39]|uniref:DUF6252 family protein n=1 Tax=Mangrovimonas futianensis TaxID=2895523 RepID=UPI001E5CE52D|nr:DUF6252 family protein [Mangrovimonas futianensis]MCF1191059.1 DUF6252 family protein [Mangrovimonas futianensis]MCF1194754.1 DUF6252 family protein [Mangrovimonas futianensis]
MKKIYVLLLAVLSLVGCQDEVEFNSPAVQGRFNGDYWKAVSMTGDYDEAGRVVITARSRYETLTIRVNAPSQGQTYQLGGESGTNSRMAALELSNGDLYSTNYLNDGESFMYPPDGEVTITRWNPDLREISGEFWFNAYNETGDETVNFSEGVFFDIVMPYVGGGDDIMSCDEAVSAAATALQAYQAASPTDANYVVVCNNYKEALMDQQVACGDATGVLQGIIDGLNCEASDQDGDGIADVDEDTNGDGDLTNDDTDGDGTPDYLDTDDDGDSILTMYEIEDALGDPLDSDSDGILDYLDNDDDNDTILTIDENPDPNGDGNPDDAQDVDSDGIPDYLDAN